MNWLEFSLRVLELCMTQNTGYQIVLGIQRTDEIFKRLNLQKTKVRIQREIGGGCMLKGCHNEDIAVFGDVTD